MSRYAVTKDVVRYYLEAGVDGFKIDSREMHGHMSRIYADEENLSNEEIRALQNMAFQEVTEEIESRLRNGR